MEQVHRIVVAVDGSEAATQATNWAARVRRDPDTLHIVTLVCPPPLC